MNWFLEMSECVMQGKWNKEKNREATISVLAVRFKCWCYGSSGFEPLFNNFQAFPLTRRSGCQSLDLFNRLQATFCPLLHI